jgi:hypothetical protein
MKREKANETVSREGDDHAKIKNMPLPDLSKYKEMAVKLLMTN